MGGYFCDAKKDTPFSRYYLVAIPEGELARKAKALQKEFSLRYGIYRAPYPPLHLTVAVISFPPEKLGAVITMLTDCVSPFLPLKLATLGESCFPAPHKSINLSVKRSEKLVKLSSKVAERVNEAGFTAEAFKSWDYHISLVNCNYADREWTEEEYEDACRRLGRKRLLFSGTARRLELWDPQYPPLKVPAAFGLAT